MVASYAIAPALAIGSKVGFEASATTLASVDSADGQYNRGNALAKAGKVEPAIEAYDRALTLNPAHEDARFNRDLLKKYLEDHPPPKQPQSIE